MDFKSKIMEVVTAAEAEIKKLIAEHEKTVKLQQEEIIELQKFKKKKEEIEHQQKEKIENQQKEIDELRKKLKVSEEEGAVLQGRLELATANSKKESSPQNTMYSEEKKPLANASLNSVENSTKENEWEQTLMQVRNDLKAATEKKKREKSYYENSTSTLPSAMKDLASLNDSLKPTIYRYKINIVDYSTLEQFIRKYDLVEREAILPLYETKNSREVYLYTEVETIFIDLLNKELYMVDEEFNKLQKRYSPLVIKYRQFSNIKHSETQTKDIKKAEIQPTSNVIEKPSSYTPTKDTLFSEQSELNKMGYRISGATRSERWNVLNRAVPELGLRKVVSIISANIRIRKKQSNGELKYQHAIAEWEYDLSRLKGKYYYGEFKWPEV